MDKKERRRIRLGYQRMRFFYFFGRFNLTLPIKLCWNFRGKTIKIKEQPFLFFANHVENLDPGYEFLCVRRYIKYVISDHLVRRSFGKKFADFFFKAIVNHREENTDILYDDIIKNIKAGINVGVHIEGGKNTNGETAYISKRNAQLVKDCDCALITYRLTGGYIKTPRWAKYVGKGRTNGNIAHFYTKEEIRKMSVDELYSHILEDLYVNAYDEQRKNPTIYKRKRPAECAETMLYCCPQCKEFATLKTEDDKIFCSCGFEAKIDEYGFWHGKNLPFDDLVSWDKFQKDLLKELTESKKGTSDLLFSDNNQTVKYLENSKVKTVSKNASLSLYGDRLEIQSKNETIKLSFDDIKKIFYISRMNLLIVTKEHYIEVSSSYPRSATKYVVSVRYLQGKENM